MPRLTLALAAALVSAPALAGTLPAFQFENFGTAGPLIRDGSDWENGYEADSWFIAQQGTNVFSVTDDNVGGWNGEQRYGSGWPADNWVIVGRDVAQGIYEVDIETTDDDTAGVVFAHNGSDAFYLLGYSANSAPPPLDSFDEPTVFLLRVDNGVGAVLDTAEVDDTLELRLRATVQDGQITGFIGNRRVIEATDDEPLEPGLAGLYAYDAGGFGGETYVFFDYLGVRQYDDDDDQIPDDDDNCEFEPNPSQADDDGDGIGNACDDTPDGEDDPTDDTGVSGDTADRTGDDVITSNGCTCASSAASAPAWPLALPVLGLGLLAWRRRRPNEPGVADR